VAFRSRPLSWAVVPRSTHLTFNISTTGPAHLLALEMGVWGLKSGKTTGRKGERKGKAGRKRAKEKNVRKLKKSGKVKNKKKTEVGKALLVLDAKGTQYSAGTTYIYLYHVPFLPFSPFPQTKSALTGARRVSQLITPPPPPRPTGDAEDWGRGGVEQLTNILETGMYISKGFRGSMAPLSVEGTDPLRGSYGFWCGREGNFSAPWSRGAGGPMEGVGSVVSTSRVHFPGGSFRG